MKTTLTSLVPRLYEPGEGRVLLDGADIAELSLGELRSQVSVAFDQPVPFSGTIAENVLLGAETGDAGLDQALRAVQADEFVHDLPDGAATAVGEIGMSPSAGQRQRIALARIMVRRPRVVVLDDPLSALDVETEAQIHDDSGGNRPSPRSGRPAAASPPWRSYSRGSTTRTPDGSCSTGSIRGPSRTRSCAGPW